MNIWFKSNIRFFRAYLPLTIAKTVSNIIGISFFMYFWFFKNTFSIQILENEYRLIAPVSILLVTCLSYNFIQRQTIHLRLKEIFVWKWFGVKRRKLLWLFFMEHVLIILISGIISIVIFDTHYQFSTSYHQEYTLLNILPPLSVFVAILTLCGFWQIFVFLKMNKKEVFNKLSS